MSVFTFLLPNVQLSPEQIERGLVALESIAESLERAYPPPPPWQTITENMLASTRPSSADDFHVYTDREADEDFIAREGLQPEDTRADSPVFSLAHTDEFGGSMREDDGEADVGLNPNGPDGPPPVLR